MPDTAPPADWKALPLGAVGQFFRGRGGTKADHDPNGLPCIRYGDLYTHHGEVVRTFHSFISPSSVRQYTPLQSGDVVFAGSGETAEEIARATAYCGTGQAYTGADTVIFRPSPALLPRFAGYAVNHDSANAFKSSRAQGSSVFHISPANLSHLPFLLPPLHEQESIAAVLKAVDEAIEHTEALIAKARQIKAGLMHDLFTRGVLPNGELRPPRSEAPQFYKATRAGYVPVEWECHSIQQLLDMGTLLDVQDGNHGELHPKRSDFVADGIPFVMANNLVDGHLDLTTCARISRKQYRSLRIGFSTTGDVLLSHKGTIGEVALVTDGVGDIMLTPQVTYYRPARHGSLLPHFLYTWMQSPVFQRYLRSIAAQSTRDYVGISSQKRLLFVVLPPQQEQEIIAERVAATAAQVHTSALQANKLRHLKRGLMHDLLTGRVRVPPSLLDGASRV